MNIKENDLKKRWFGFQNKDRRSADSALLVNYDSSAGGENISAHIYATGQTLIGSIDYILSEIAKASKNNHKIMTGEDAPEPEIVNGKKVTYAFFTQAWQGETREIANGKLFFVKKEVV